MLRALPIPFEPQGLVSGYLSLLPTLLLVVGVFGLFFVLIAEILRMLRGPAAVWTWLALAVPLLTGSCIYKLSGLASGSSWTSAGLAYYSSVALATIGIPLWYSARGLLLLTSRQPPPQIQWRVLGAWAICLSAVPVALIALFIIDALATL